MRVLQVLTQASGGPVDHAADVAVGLAARGHDSHLLGPARGAGERDDGDGVVRHRLAVRDKRDLAGAAAVVRRVRALRPDVVHLHDRRAAWLGRLLAPWLPGTAVVHTLHGVADGLADLVEGNARVVPRRRRDGPYYLTGERWATRLGGGRVVTPCRALAAFAVDRVGVPAGLVDVVPNGVDVDRFVPGRPERGPDDGPTAVVLGGLEEGKRVGGVLDAVAGVPGLRLVVAGDGPQRPAVERRAGRDDLRGRVRVLGAVADPAPLLRDADLLVLGSAAEGCPMAVLQAMAAGLPVVATAVGGVPEVVRDGVEGLLVPADDVAALGAPLAALAADPRRRALLGDAARRRVVEGFTLDDCLDGLLASYDRARDEEVRPACGSSR